MTKIVRSAFYTLLLLSATFIGKAQNVAINTDGSTANASSLLDVKSTDKGVLIPRMSKTQKNAITTPATGLLVFQNTPDSIGFHYFNGTIWVWLTDGSNADTTAWKITGNNNIKSSNFLGTTNDSALHFRVRNLPSGLIDSASANAHFGYRAGSASTTGFSNVIVGNYAMVNNRLGFANVAVGSGSQQNNDTANRSVSVGTSSNFFNKQSGQTALGYQAAAYNNYNSTGALDGRENTAVGYQANWGNFRGDKNTAVGYRSLFAGQGSTIYATWRNTAVGDSALAYTVGDQNTAVGNAALSIGFASYNNVAVGDSAMGKAVNTSNNVAVGARALRQTIATYPNTAVGVSSQDSATTAGANTSLGSYALMSNKTGGNNVAIGNAAMMEAFNANAAYPFDNTAVGNDALRRNRYYGETALGAGALRNDTAGTFNTALGYLSQYERLRGYSNVSVGTSALRNDTTGVQNTAIGTNAMFYHRRGDNNTAIGMSALFNSREGNANTAVGVNALTSHVKNDLNTAVGFESMYSDTSGSSNTAMGWRSLRYAKNGFENTAVGVGTLEFTDSSRYNTAIGRGAMIGIGGQYNTVLGYFAAGSYAGVPTTNYYVNNMTAIGSYAGNRNIANDNTFLGYAAGYGGVDSLRGTENTGLGTLTLANTTTGRSNTAVGLGPLFNNTTGSYNIAVGTRALLNNTTGNYNVAIGDSTMEFNSGNNNVAVGPYALRFNGTGSSNVAIGNTALYNNNTGVQNVAIGENSLGGNYSGSLNVAVGAGSKDQNGSGSRNVALGFWADRADTSGSNNVSIGHVAMYFNRNRSSMVAIGDSALYINGNGVLPGNTVNALRNTAVGSANLRNNSTGYNNTALGYRALYTVSIGNSNTAIGNAALGSTIANFNTAVGDSALYTSQNANLNTGLGYKADVSSAALVNTTAIGARALVSASNSMVLGSINGVNGATASVNVGIGESSPNARLHITRSGASGGGYLANSSMILEDNTTSYIQLSHPDANETGILSGNATQTIRSGIIFGSNNSLILRSGGNTDRLYINNGGYAGFNRTPTTGLSAGSVQVTNVSTTDDQFGIYNSLGNRWTFYVSNNVTPSLQMFFDGSARGSWANATGVYTAVSDKRFKKDVTDFNYGLETVKALNALKYHYLDGKTSDPYAVGFMAQDVMKVYPEAVYSNIDKAGKEFYTMDYQSFGVLSIKAIQEQQAIIEKQQKAIDDLLKRVEQLEKK